MRMARSASVTWRARASASEWTAIASMPRSRQARMTRQAISPRLATRTRFSIGRNALAALLHPPWLPLLEERLQSFLAFVRGAAAGERFGRQPEHVLRLAAVHRAQQLLHRLDGA